MNLFSKSEHNVLKPFCFQWKSNKNKNRNNSALVSMFGNGFVSLQNMADKYKENNDMKLTSKYRKSNIEDSNDDSRLADKFK